MINAKKLYHTILNVSTITDIVPTILDSYPNEITTFPCIIFEESDQNDTEFADNLPLANNCSFRVHIFTKALKKYKTTSEIGLVVANVLKNEYFSCTGNREVADPEDNVRHRVMDFRREVFTV